jgi:hypothetical protein
MNGRPGPGGPATTDCPWRRLFSIHESTRAGKATPAIVTGIVTLSIAGGGYALGAGHGGASIKVCVTQGTHALYKAPCATQGRKVTLSKTGRSRRDL